LPFLDLTGVPFPRNTIPLPLEVNKLEGAAAAGAGLSYAHSLNAWDWS